MKSSQIRCYFLVFPLTSCNAIEPISGVTAVAAGLSAIFITSFNAITCQFKECCRGKWINLNATGDIKYKYILNIISMEYICIFEPPHQLSVTGLTTCQFYLQNSVQP